MSDQPPAGHDEMRAWALSEAVARTMFKAATWGSAPSKTWLTFWITVILAVNTSFVLVGAPQIAYGVPLICLLLVSRSDIQFEMGTSRSRGVQRRRPDS